MKRRHNYIFKLLDYFQCIIGDLTVQSSLIHKIKIKNLEAKKISIKSLVCFGLKVSQSNLSFSRWTKVDLRHTEMKDCQIEGLKINGYLISDLIQDKTINSSTSDGE